MKFLFALLILLNTANVMACVCSVRLDDKPGYRDHEDLRNYTFIALVEIKELPTLDAVSLYGRSKPDINIEIKEQFKGKPITTVFDDAYNSDCALELKVGEQWLFFGVLDKNTNRTLVGSCGFSRRYRDVDGRREWAYFTGITDIDLLRKLYIHPGAGFKERLFYPNGKLEVEQTFKDHKLNGVRKIYYPSGQLYVEEKFKNGYRTDFRRIYGPSGQLLSVILYQDGLAKSKTRYHDSIYVNESLTFKSQIKKNFEFEKDPGRIKHALDSLQKTIDWKHIASLTTYEKDGRSYQQIAYYPTGKLSNTSYIDWVKQITERSHYREDGTLQYYVKDDLANDQSIEYDYKEDGTRKDFVKRCDFCAITFDRNKLPEAWPEKIFVQ